MSLSLATTVCATSDGSAPTSGPGLRDEVWTAMTTPADMPSHSPAYEPPALEVLGHVHELTGGCDKMLGSTDGFTFQGSDIVCGS